jgi:hypothetical protein
MREWFPLKNETKLPINYTNQNQTRRMSERPEEMKKGRRKSETLTLETVRSESKDEFWAERLLGV